MKYEEIKAMLIEAMEDMSTSEIVSLYNEYAEANGYEMVYSTDEFDEIFSGATPSEVVNSIATDFNLCDNYMYFDGYGHVKSFDDIYDDNPIYFGDLADWIIDEDRAGEFIEVEEEEEEEEVA